MSEQLRKAIEPKSDQLNADDFIAVAAVTVTIKEVDFVSGFKELKTRIKVEEFDRFYMPSKGMTRVMTNAWGEDEQKWIGEKLVLYREPSVKFGDETVGGIRISHMTGLDTERKEFEITQNRGSRKKHVVYRLQTELQPYSQEKFERLLPQWEAAINAGKMTRDEIIARAESVAIVSDEQKERIQELGNQPTNEGT